MSKREKKVVIKCSFKKRVFSLFKTLLAEKNIMLLNNQRVNTLKFDFVLKIVIIIIFLFPCLKILVKIYIAYH